MANVGNPVSVQEMQEVQATARKLGHEVASFEIRRTEDIALVFEALKGHADVLYVCGDLLVDTNRLRIITLALGVKLPTISDFPEYVETGGLMSYGPNFPDLFRRAGGYVDKILRGAKPGDIDGASSSRFSAARPLVARAQQERSVRLIAMLMGQAESDPGNAARAPLGWIDGRNGLIISNHDVSFSSII